MINLILQDPILSHISPESQDIKHIEYEEKRKV